MIEKLKKVQHMGNVDRNDLVKVGHGKLNVESIELDEAMDKNTKLKVILKLEAYYSFIIMMVSSKSLFINLYMISMLRIQILKILMLRKDDMGFILKI